MKIQRMEKNLYFLGSLPSCLYWKIKIAILTTPLIKATQLRKTALISRHKS